MEGWKPETAFSVALKEFISRPTNSKRKTPTFIQRVLDGEWTTPHDVNEELQRLETETSQRTTRRVLRNVFNAVSNYSGVIGVLCQADPYPSALVWGGLKAVIECFHRYSDLFKRLVGQLDALAQQLNRLKHYEALFSASEDMMDLIVFSYKSIIRFWITVEDQCRAPAYKLALKSLTSFNTTRVEEIVADVNAKIDNIEKYLPIIQEQFSRRDKADASKERAQAQVTLSRILQTMSESREEAKRKQVYTWIAGAHGSVLSDSNASRHKRRLGRQLDGTGQWLLEDYHFRHWLEPDSGSNVLWLRGGAGVGKSIICSHAINELERLRPKAAIASHFFSFDEEETPMDIYRSLAVQLYESLYGDTGEVSERLWSLLRGDVAKQVDLQRAIKALLLEASSAFVFIDGLDEQCEDLKKNKKWDQVSDIISFLNATAQETEIALKLWYSSQDNQSIRNLLSESEEIQLGAAINSIDIERFLTLSLTSTQFLEIESSIKAMILKNLKKQVNGSFLWASLMIDVIKEAPTVRHIFHIVEEGFPDDFETYLQRMISRYPHSIHEFIRHLLNVETDVIATECGKSIEGHAFLEYAAKYWHRHLDELQYSKDLGDMVMDFVCSPNFRTCLQVQSLSFGRQFDIRHTKRGDLHEIQLFKPFPRWLTTEHTDGAQRQKEYNDAIIEWSHFLSRYSTYRGTFKGDVRRCLWSTLGARNFLHKFPTAFKCFILEDRTNNSENDGLIYDRVSPDGSEIDLMKLEEP
ncbi:hypothetical protein CGLO_01212 [Colletotrichum gloeosporioides Cg-14]|uniref:Uncharacterized protein n=1 Tax=Colletotrichum gloeosporioides (strain Cg-14) TaxID=1237896 RepID=T0KSQ7_COLGC|nr:hypothetical protein CGLO_01212 [Colletotrichum gloeosporioides Cg-14]